MNLRVAARALKADKVGELQELLRQYSEMLRQFDYMAPTAKEVLQTYEKIFKLTAMSHEERIRRFGDLDAYMSELKALRDKTSGPNLGSALIVRVSHGWGHLAKIAKPLCWAIIQQLVLPPKLRKSIELISRFWNRQPRKWKPKSIYSLEEREAAWTEKYLEDLEVYRKHEVVFQLALQQGKEHIEEGEAATRVRAGSFTLVNTGGFDQITMDRLHKVIEEVEQRMRSIGLGQVCYGDILITNRLKQKATVAAFYVYSNDEIFVRADAKMLNSTVLTICHELTHRYEHKFMGTKRGELAKLYATIQRGNRFFNPDPSDLPKVGEVFKYKGKSYKVEAVDSFTGKIKITSPDAPNSMFSAPLNVYLDATGVDNREGLYFVTPYAKSGGPSENFCEMVAFYALGKLPPEQVELIKPLL